MIVMLSNLTFKVHPSLAVKDPTSSDLGWQILRNSITLMNDIGLEHFTFKKLAQRIGCTEASVYRYFENKHKLLLYLCNWHWGFISHHIVINAAMLTTANEKLEFALKLIASPFKKYKLSQLDTETLHKLVIAEGPKIYLIKEVDDKNAEGYYLSYKGLCGILAGYIQSINPDYKYANTLASSILELCHSQIFFSEHLPRLTDINSSNYKQLQNFVLDLTQKTLNA